MDRIASPARPSPRRQPPDQRTFLRREDWVASATDVLVEEGIDRVRIDVLAKMLSVSRGSFYWHFKNRDELLRAVLAAWRLRATEQVTERFERTAGTDPHGLVRELLELPHRGRTARRGARIEQAIRFWARNDEAARQVVDEADVARLGYISQVFSALGFGIAEARQRAFLLYAYEQAESLLPNQGTPAQKKERLAFTERLLKRAL